MKKINAFFYLALTAFPTSAFSFTGEDLKGSWAMKQLYNGIANVIEFDGKTTLTLHPFRCDSEGKSKTDGKTEKYQYKVSGASIFLYQDGEIIEELKVSNFSPTEMTALEVGVDLTFSYTKIEGVRPTCYQK